MLYIVEALNVESVEIFLKLKYHPHIRGHISITSFMCSH